MGFDDVRYIWGLDEKELGEGRDGGDGKCGCLEKSNER